MAKGIREKIKLVFCYLLAPILIASVHSWRCYA